MCREHFFVKTPMLKSDYLGGEPPQLRGDRQALLVQEVVKSAAAESLQVHLVLIIPELVRGVRTNWVREEEREMQIRKGRVLAQGQLLIAVIKSFQGEINEFQTFWLHE